VPTISSSCRRTSPLCGASTLRCSRPFPSRSYARPTSSLGSGTSGRRSSATDCQERSMRPTGRGRSSNRRPVRRDRWAVKEAASNRARSAGGTRSTRWPRQLFRRSTRGKAQRSRPWYRSGTGHLRATASPTRRSLRIVARWCCRKSRDHLVRS
jgi:hypothetical protein